MEWTREKIIETLGEMMNTLGEVATDFREEEKAIVFAVDPIKAMEETEDKTIMIQGTSRRDFNIYSRGELSLSDALDGLIHYGRLTLRKKIGFGYVVPSHKPDAIIHSVGFERIDPRYQTDMIRFMNVVQKKAGNRFEVR